MLVEDAGVMVAAGTGVTAIANAGEELLLPHALVAITDIEPGFAPAVTLILDMVLVPLQPDGSVQV